MSRRFEYERTMQAILHRSARWLTLLVLFVGCSGDSSQPAHDASAQERDAQQGDGDTSEQDASARDGSSRDDRDASADDDAGAPGKDWEAADGEVALADLCSELTDTYCSLGERCCKELPNGLCEIGMMYTCSNDIRKWLPENSGLRYDPKAGGSWLRQVKKEVSACAPVTRGLPTKLFHAYKTTGQSCIGYECLPTDSACLIVNGGPGVCEPLSGVGETCATKLCKAGLVCTGPKMVCAEPVTHQPGQDCSDYQACAAGTTCLQDGGTRRCLPTRNNGQACELSVDCTSNRCRAGGCVACSAAEDCYCDYGSICYGCSADGACKHIPPGTKGVAPNGTGCTRHEQCQSGWCIGEVCEVWDSGASYCNSIAPIITSWN